MSNTKQEVLYTEGNTYSNYYKENKHMNSKVFDYTDTESTWPVVELLHPDILRCFNALPVELHEPQFTKAWI